MSRFTRAPAVAAGLLLLVSCSDSGSPEATPSAPSSEEATASSTSSTPESPFAGDSAWVAYQTDRTGDESVWLVQPDGSEDHQVLTELPNALLPDWSPDGQHLAVTTRGGETEPLFEYDLEADTSRQLFDCSAPCLGDDEPVYSPDGSTIAFIRYLGPVIDDAPADCSLWVGDRDSGKVQRVTNNGSGCDREYNPRWSPDGERLTYWRQPSADGRTSTTAVFTVAADGSDERRLTKPALEAGEADWSPDGTWIVFATRPLAQFEDGISNLYRIHPDGTGLEQLTTYATDKRATQPQYTPDGAWIIYTSVTATTRTLAAIPADGGDAVAITSDGIATHGTWQP